MGEEPDPGLEDLGAVAQLGERLICIQEVAGSIPTSSTSGKPLRALDSEDGQHQLVHTETGAKQGDGRPSVGGKPVAIIPVSADAKPLARARSSDG